MRRLIFNTNITAMRNNQTFFFTMLFLAVGIVAHSQTFSLVPHVKGFKKPVDIENTGVQNDDRLFIAEQGGRIKIIAPDKSILSTPFLDITDRVNSASNERGLLGFAFHPHYNENGYFFVNYSDQDGATTISRFSVDPSDPNLALSNSEKIIMTIDQPYTNHNAGDMVFGPDGYLYFGTGDGGSGGDPQNRSQNPKELLGKMIRIDIDSEETPYEIPNTNPYVNNPDTLDAIWAFGLRNPWKIHIDTASGLFWIADVGQNKREEINAVPYDQPKVNYGWRCYEGIEKYNFSNCSDNTNFTLPIHDYTQESTSGCSVIGGYVYHGHFLSMKGLYFFTDYCNGVISTLQRNIDGTYTREDVFESPGSRFSSFGADIKGELFLADLSKGTIYQLVDLTTTTEDLSNDGIENIILYPNPTSGSIQLKWDGGHLPTDQWLVSGVSMIAKQITPQLVDHRIIFDIEHLPEGFYILRHPKLSRGFKFVKLP